MRIRTFLLALLAAGFHLTGGEFTLLHPGGVPAVGIFVMSADPAVRRAEAELIAVLRRIGSDRDYRGIGSKPLLLAIAGDRSCEMADKAMAANRLTPESLGNEGFLLHQQPDRTFILCAFSGKGVLNGAYRLLAENLQVAFPRPEMKCDFPELTKTRKMVKTPFIGKPAFECRGISSSFADVNHPPYNWFDWLARNNLNYFAMEAGGFAQISHAIAPYGFLYGMGGHAFHFWIPPREYAKTHPEFFSLNEGKRDTRSHGSQLALGNPELVNEIVRKMLEYKKRNPQVTILPFGYNDSNSRGLGFGDDPLCLALDSPRDLPQAESGLPRTWITRYIRTANEIIRRVNEVYPDVKLHVWSYLYEMIRPPDCEVHPNLQVEFAQLYKCMIHPVNDPKCPRNAFINKWLVEWSKVTKNIVFRDYYLGSTRYYPITPLRVMQKDLQHFRNLGLAGVKPESVADAPDGANLQGAPTNAWRRPDTFFRTFWDANALLHFAYARLSWNPDEPIENIVSLFCRNYYGEKTGRIMAQYYLALERNFEKSGHPGENPRVSKVGDYLHIGQWCMTWNWEMLVNDYARRIFLDDPEKYALPLANLLFAARNAADASRSVEITERVDRANELFNVYLLSQGYELSRFTNKPPKFVRKGSRTLIER